MATCCYLNLIKLRYSVPSCTTTFQMFKSHMWLVATLLDSTCVMNLPLLKKSFIGWHCSRQKKLFSVLYASRYHLSLFCLFRGTHVLSLLKSNASFKNYLKSTSSMELSWNWNWVCCFLQICVLGLLKCISTVFCLPSVQSTQLFSLVSESHFLWVCMLGRGRTISHLGDSVWFTWTKLCPHHGH